MVGLPDGEKIEDICNRLGTIPACDRRTDILPRHIRAMHMRRAVKIENLSPCKIVTHEVVRYPA